VLAFALVFLSVKINELINLGGGNGCHEHKMVGYTF